MTSEQQQRGMAKKNSKLKRKKKKRDKHSVSYQRRWRQCISHHRGSNKMKSWRMAASMNRKYKQ